VLGGETLGPDCFALPGLGLGLGAGPGAAHRGPRVERTLRPVNQRRSPESGGSGSRWALWQGPPAHDRSKINFEVQAPRFTESNQQNVGAAALKGVRAQQGERAPCHAQGPWGGLGIRPSAVPDATRDVASDSGPTYTQADRAFARGPLKVALWLGAWRLQIRNCRSPGWRVCGQGVLGDDRCFHTSGSGAGPLRAYLRGWRTLVAPHLVLAPGLAIVLVLLSVNLLGDTLRDRLDVRLGERG
jgi:hypothetical protein